MSDDNQMVFDASSKLDYTVGHNSYSNSSARSGYKRKREEEGDNSVATTTNNNNEDLINILWKEDEHQNFVSSIFEIGLKHASPSIIMENMCMKQTQKDGILTSERIKSKLQKYRKNKLKSKEDFMREYLTFLERIKSLEAGSTISSSTIYSTQDDSDSSPLIGGDIAGYLTCVVMKDSNNKKTKREISDKHNKEKTINQKNVLSTNILRKGARDYVDNYAGSAIHYPVLTETEKKSALGIAMTFIMGLFLSMSQHLTRERARAESIGLKLSSSSPSSMNDHYNEVFGKKIDRDIVKNQSRDI